MRRKDREITDAAKIKDIIMSCECCRLGFADGESVYIVPLNFGYKENGGQKILYFHGAKEGRKADLIKKNGYAGFELDTNHQLNEDENPCEFSYRFQSVIGEGPVSVIQDARERKEALQFIMEHYSDKQGWNFSDAMLAAIVVFKLEVREMACKEHL
jgi:uncharacterized protein